MIGLLFGIILGVLLSIIIFYLAIKKRVHGVLYVNKFDPDLATVGISFNVGGNELSTKKYIFLEVHTQE